jgi:hypothetical protein
MNVENWFADKQGYPTLFSSCLFAATVMMACIVFVNYNAGSDAVVNKPEVIPASWVGLVDCCFEGSSTDPRCGYGGTDGILEDHVIGVSSTDSVEVSEDN